MTNEELLKVIEEAKASGATYLYLRRQKLTTLPPELFQLTNLTTLDLSANNLTTLPKEICQLRSLREIHLWENKLTALPQELGQLRNLQKLYLWNNKLTNLPMELFQFTSLTELHLGGNQLTTLPPEIGQLTKLEYLLLNGNPLISPPLEIATQGIKAIRQYFASLQQEDHPLNQVKILLLGDGASGKTSLTKRLISNEFDPQEPVTHGIRITPWNVEAASTPIKANIWDFGGQEIMHATHQFFLSKRSLYVIVLDGRKDEQAEYWLRHVSTFGGSSPVLIVLNKQDENCGFAINSVHLKRKYPAIKGFYSTSCKKDAGIMEFRAALLTELARVEMLEIRWPKSWFLVKERLEQMPQPYISCDEYESYCQEAGIPERASQEVLVEFLHDLGVAVHFKDLELDATHVLNPLWLTNGVYRLITAEKTARQGGVLHKDDLRELLEKRSKDDYEYPREKHPYLLKLMQKFELCYDLDNERVLIPQLLPVKEPEFSFDESACLRFILHYPHFLPPSVFPRFLVKVHKDIKGDLRWRTGAVLVNEEFGAEALVRADNETRQISIFVNGSQRKDYFAVLLLFFREINATFEQLNVNELVPMPDAPDVTARYSTLLKLAEKGRDEYLPDDSEKEYSVKELLGLVQFNEQADVLEKILSIVMRMEDRQLEDEKSFIERAHNMLELKPSLFGIGINANAVLDELFKRLKQQRAKRKKIEQKNQ
ncbi:COR domain-containing protein [Candidatus Electronema sp. JM]|uniref:COR domain-containing protein n=1 Tax=Candidatus Electronema sp. JM TaxID=3401571 RepID=UPI003AA9BC5A